MRPERPLFSGPQSLVLPSQPCGVHLLCWDPHRPEGEEGGGESSSWWIKVVWNQSRWVGRFGMLHVQLVFFQIPNHAYERKKTSPIIVRIVKYNSNSVLCSFVELLKMCRTRVCRTSAYGKVRVGVKRTWQRFQKRKPWTRLLTILRSSWCSKPSSSGLNTTSFPASSKHPVEEQRTVTKQPN